MSSDEVTQRSISPTSVEGSDASDAVGLGPSSSGSSLDTDTVISSIAPGRRKSLPEPMAGEDAKLVDFLKKSIGKDLSRVTFPVTFNEPLSMLQRMAEEIEYSELLDRAVATSNPIERIALVTAFAISGYACTKFRPGRKPFNPMLGETFEDRRTNFVAEKCSHHPPVMACQAEGEGWKYWATIEAKNSFTGRSLKVEPVGWSHVQIGKDVFKWDKPASYVRNVILGDNKFFEHVGSMTIKNARTQMSAEVHFKEKTIFSRNPANTVTAKILSANNETLAEIGGTWDTQLTLTIPLNIPNCPGPRQIWSVNPYPLQASKYYGFTDFAMSLNEITETEGPNLPLTDSRHRPDQRLMEQGKMKEAEDEKNKLEDAQRDRRKRGTDRVPRWFRKVAHKKGHPDEWEYVGGYWEARDHPFVDNGERLW